MRHLWQSVAALVSAYRDPQTSLLEESVKEIPLQELLKDTDNVHALKLIDACEREHIITPNPAFQKVASDFCQA